MQKSAIISEELEIAIEIILIIIPDEEANNSSNSNSENLLEFRYIFLFCIKYIRNITKIKNLYFRN